MKYLVPIVMIFLFLTACDMGLEITGIEIEQYPSKIVYLEDVDSELDLTGGVIALNTKNGKKYEYAMEDNQIEISHNVDFNTPGVYVVTLVRHQYVCKFPVQVINKEYFEAMGAE